MSQIELELEQLKRRIAELEAVDSRGKLDATNIAIKSRIAKNGFGTNTNTLRYSEQINDSLFQKNQFFSALITTPQFGKTNIFINSILMAIRDGHIRFTDFTIITGLSNTDWVSQTKSRVPKYLRDSLVENNIAEFVAHRNSLIGTKGTALAQRIKKVCDNDDKFVIVIDEGHIASGSDQSLFRFFHTIYSALSPGTGGVSKEEMFTHLNLRGVKLLFVSATLDGVKISLETTMAHMGNIIAAKPWDIPTYSWMDDFVTRGIVRESVPYVTKEGNVTKKGVTMIKEIVDHIISLPPGYSMFRPASASYEKMIDAIKTGVENRLSNDSVKVLYYDVAHPLVSSEGKSMNIEEYLSHAPTQHTLIVTKDMIRIAQTIPTSHIRVMCDRPTSGSNPNVSTIIQSFAGRLCGHNRGADLNNIRLFSSVKEIEKYINLVKNNYDARIVPYSGYSLKKKGKAENTCLFVDSTYVGETKVLTGIGGIGSADTGKTGNIHQLKRSLNNKNGFVRRIADFYLDRGFSATEPTSSLAFTLGEINAGISGDTISSITDYTRWASHGRYALLANPEGEPHMYIINPEVAELVESLRTE